MIGRRNDDLMADAGWRAWPSGTAAPTAVHWRDDPAFECQRTSRDGRILPSNQQHHAAFQRDLRRRPAASRVIRAPRNLREERGFRGYRRSRGQRDKRCRRQFRLLHSEHQQAVRHDQMLVIVVRLVAGRSVMGVLFMMPGREVTCLSVADRLRHEAQISAAQAAKPQGKAENLRQEQQQNCTRDPGL